MDQEIRPREERTAEQRALEKLTGVGRSELERRIAEAAELSERAKAIIAAKDAEIARLTTHSVELARNLTSVQARSTELIQSLRASNYILAFHRQCSNESSEAFANTMAVVAAHIVIARQKHPHGPTKLSLSEEAGEVARAWRDDIDATAKFLATDNPADRKAMWSARENFQSECLDAAAVAIRLYLGEHDDR